MSVFWYVLCSRVFFKITSLSSYKGVWKIVHGNLLDLKRIVSLWTSGAVSVVL